MDLLISLIFLSGLILRIVSVYPSNTIIGFDQVRDFFDTRAIILDNHSRVIGPIAGNNPNLHHGVAYLYFLLPPLTIFEGNPMAAVYWNIFWSNLVVVLYFFAQVLFKSSRVGTITALLAASSFDLTQFAGWLSNPTVTLLTVPLFFTVCGDLSKEKKNF